MDPNKPTRKMRFIPKLPSHKRTRLSSYRSTSSEAAEAEGRVNAQGSSRGGSRDDMQWHSPIHLPWRKPHSGDEVPDDDESGDDAADMEYDANTVNDSAVLGLVPEDQRRRFMFFQFPTSLPFDKGLATTKKKGEESHNNSDSPDLQKLEQTTEDVVGSLQQGCSLEELPQGYMGKMLVYKSGKVKLKLGEVLFDVSRGPGQCDFPEDVAVINRNAEQCCVIGKIEKQAVVTPDIFAALKKESK